MRPDPCNGLIISKDKLLMTGKADVHDKNLKLGKTYDIVPKEITRCRSIWLKGGQARIFLGGFFCW